MIIFPIVITEKEKEALDEATHRAILDTPMWVFYLWIASLTGLCGYVIYDVVKSTWGVG